MSDLEVQAAVSKIAKYAVQESGDTVELVERPHGGISVVVVDGQRSGRSAKTISNLVARKALSLLAEGVRDGAVARATHDYLRTHRRGKVSAELVIASADLTTNTLVVSRNSRCPVLLWRSGELHRMDEPTEAVGIHRNTKPAIEEFAIEAGLSLVVLTDGVLQAGSRSGRSIDLPAVVQEADPHGAATARAVADHILHTAIALDDGRPQDDSSVMVLKIVPQHRRDQVRRLTLTFPL